MPDTANQQLRNDLAKWRRIAVTHAGEADTLRVSLAAERALADGMANFIRDLSTRQLAATDKDYADGILAAWKNRRG